MAVLYFKNVYSACALMFTSEGSPYKVIKQKLKKNHLNKIGDHLIAAVCKPKKHQLIDVLETLLSLHLQILGEECTVVFSHLK